MPHSYLTVLTLLSVSNHQTLMPLNGHVPLLGNNVFVAPSASVMGRVQVGEGSSIWYNAVLRGMQGGVSTHTLHLNLGDVNDIKIGNRTNVQDNVTIHTASDASGAPKPTIVGNDCTIGRMMPITLQWSSRSTCTGHNVVLHACTIEDGCMVGMGSTLLDGVTVRAVHCSLCAMATLLLAWRDVDDDNITLFAAQLHKGSIVGAGSLVLKGTTVPSGEVWVGSPARFLRKLTEVCPSIHRRCS